MSYEGIVKKILGLLNKAGVFYMLTGGIAANYYGCARATYDLDIVVEPKKENIKRFLRLASRARFRFHEKEILLILQKGNRFILESPERYRADFWLAKTPLDLQMLRRRRRVKIFGVSAWMCSPEDLIIQKLRSRRPRDIEDIQAILLRQSGRLDEEYLEARAAELGLSKILTRQKRLIQNL